MRLLIIGNGNIAVKNGHTYVNSQTAVFCSELLPHLSNLSYLQFSKPVVDNDNLLDSKLDNLIAVHHARSSGTGRAIKLLCYMRMSVLLIKAVLNNDFIYIFYPGHLPTLSVCLCILLRKKYGLYIRGYRDYSSAINAYIIRKSRFVFTVSGIIENVVARYNSNVNIILPMIPFSRDQILTEKCFSSDGITRCLYVGRVEPEKGISELVMAIDLLLSSSVRIEFDIVGGGRSFESVKNHFSGSSQVRVHGLVKDPAVLCGFYRRADLFVFPSRNEGFPRVLYEAMIFRVPILTTIVGGIGSIMKNNYNCLEIKPNNFQSIAEKVYEIIDNPQLRSALVNQGTGDILRILDGNRKPHSTCLMEALKAK